MLTTGTGARSGTYLLLVQKGEALVFTTDLNNNGQVDYNEITGIAAGDGLRMTSFVDIHGDIVTNLNADGTLTDSDNNSSNNPVSTKGDGLVLKNSRIEGITMRSLTIADLTDQNGDKVVNNLDVDSRLAMSSYSIFGQILAGGGFGIAGDTTSGLRVDDTGKASQLESFDPGNGAFFGNNYYVDVKSSIGAIRTGTAANGEYFAFGYSRGVDVQGTLVNFTQPAGLAGGDIANVTSTNTFNVSGLYAGDGGLGARGGNIQDIRFDGDNASGYQLVAGNGGRGSTGGGGGSIINFTDLGSVTGQVLLKTGDGGQGTNGLGGDGGTLGLSKIVTNAGGVNGATANISLNAGMTIDLGNGGSGFRGGGMGASLNNAIIRAPDGGVAYAQTVVSTTHDSPHDPVSSTLLNTGVNFKQVIGRANGFDLNGDGFNDIVFTTSTPEQLVVQFGDGQGGFLLNLDGTPQRVYLDGPGQAQAIAVGDVNGDGYPDVVVASNQAGDFAGVTVFLAKFEDANHTGGLTPSEDLNHNGVNDFLGFSSPRTSPLPSLASGDPAAGVNGSYGYVRSSNPISDIAIGDFNGDGLTEIAVTATYITPSLHTSQILFTLTPDVENGHPDGHFYADVGTKASNGAPPNGIVPFVNLGIGNNARIESTALSQTATHDVVVSALVKGTLSLRAVSDTSVDKGLTLTDFSTPSPFGPTILNVLGLGSVDTDRSDKTNFQPASVRDFAVVDFGSQNSATPDGNADFLAVTEGPSPQYLVGLSGDGVFNGTIVTGTGNNAGYFFGPTSDIVAIRGSLPTVPLAMHGAAVLDYNSASPAAAVRELIVAGGGINNITETGGYVGPLQGDKGAIAFDTFMRVGNSDPTPYYAVGSPDTSGAASDSQTIYSTGLLGAVLTPESEQFVKVHAGDGGVGVIGAGGAGGNIGTGVLTQSKVNGVAQLNGGFDFTFPSSLHYQGIVDLHGGAGGAGFSNGGAGGSVGGVALRPQALFSGGASIEGGDGGQGTAGTGGVGGSIGINSLYATPVLVAGNGGSGVVGGAGGSIGGHNIAGFTDNNTNTQQLFAGMGGDGVRLGGAGGAVVNYHGQFSNGGGFLAIGGTGGEAVAGTGGAGGVISNLSPFANNGNGLSGDINLIGGDGGGGLNGGAGGYVSTFRDAPSQGDTPGVLAIVAGNGGVASGGVGGAGGYIFNVVTPSNGSHRAGTAVLVIPPPAGSPAGTLGSTYTRNHFTAGNGGDSFGYVGGAGGSVSYISTSASDGNFGVVAGAGGYGLVLGGDGGPVDNVRLDIGGLNSKALIIAGAGGDAGAYVSPNVPANSSTAFGGRIGKGGNGGAVFNFLQVGGTGSHSDIIAGNGGDTVNYGTVNDTTAGNYVGTGGSVFNISIAGTLGNVDSNIPIKAYNNVAIGQTIADFVDTSFRNPATESAIDDSVGNVGVIVGGAGRLKSNFIGYDQNHDPIFRGVAAFGSLSGDLHDVRANAIMAAVADSVDRIATIHAAYNLSFPSGGSIGTDKTPTDKLQYLSKTGSIISEPVVDGALIDGALIVGSTPSFANGQASGHIFVLT